MRLALVTASVLVLLSPALSGRQAPVVDYVITPHIFEASADGVRSTDLIGPVLLRTRAGEPATVDLSDAQAGTRLVLVPTDLGSGRVALRVELSVTSSGRTATSVFDALTGAEAQQATFAARDIKGKFLVGPGGMPIYATFDVTTRPRR